MTKRGASIRILLIDGTPEGMRIATKSNWTGRVLMAARTDYARLRDRDELKAPGIYILVGPPDEGLKDRVYVGETDDLVARLYQHRFVGLGLSSQGGSKIDKSLLPREH